MQKKNKKWFQINNLTLLLKQLEKEHIEPKFGKEINNKDYSKNRWNREQKNIIKVKSWFSENKNKTGQPLATLIKEIKEKTQIKKIINRKGDITINTTEIQRL